MHNSTQNTTIHQSPGFAKSARDFIRRISPGIFTFMFDEENSINILKKCEFTNVDFRTFDPLIDLAERDSESMHIKASK
jgi:hypothetical protein